MPLASLGWFSPRYFRSSPHTPTPDFFFRRDLLSLKEYSDQKTYFAKVDQSALLDFAGGSMFRKEWLQQSKTYFAKIVQSGP